VRIEIGYQTDERQDFAFRGRFPAVGVGAVDGGEIGVVVRIAEENVAFGGDLRAGQAREQ
jgi:hypothetical protein